MFAGIKNSRLGSEPTGIGRLCEWKEDSNEVNKSFVIKVWFSGIHLASFQQTSQNHKSFGAFQRSLSLDCQEGQPGIVQWTPDKNTPDLVYYQCYTHRWRNTHMIISKRRIFNIFFCFRYLGWKIHVVDKCNVWQILWKPNREGNRR